MTSPAAVLLPVRCDDPRVIADSVRNYCVINGGSSVTSKPFVATSVSNSQIIWSCPPPSNRVFIDRAVRLSVPVRISMTGVPALGQTLLVSGFDAPRAYPLSGSIETLTATINNQTISISLGDVIHPLSRFNTDVNLKAEDYSLTPIYPDQSQEYNSLQATVRNPLGDYSLAVDGTPSPRGAFAGMVVIANPVGDGVTPVTAQVDLAMSEWLHMSPFYWAKGLSNRGLFGVSTLDISANFTGRAERMWSHCVQALQTVAFTSMSYVFGGNPGGPTSFGVTGNVCQALFTYISPKATQMVGPETALAWNSLAIQRYPTALAPIASGASATVTSTSITLSSIPDRIYVCCRKTKVDLQSSAANTDSYLAVNSMSLSFGNVSGILASANAYQLYQMAVNAGCNLDWTQWSGSAPPIGNLTNARFGTVGSILCLRPGIDFGLDTLEAPGMLGQYTMQIQLNVTNTSAAQITPDLVIITSSEGVLDIAGAGSSTIRTGIVTPGSVIETSQMPNHELMDIEPRVGGSFGSSLRSGLDKIAKGLKHEVLNKQLISRGLSKVPLPAAQTAAQVASLLGFGQVGGVMAGRAPAKPRKSRAKKGGVMAGGADMSRAELAARILA